MAKIKMGLVVTEASGKLGGHVFTKNRGGAALRTKVSPANPQTASQSNVRAGLTAFAQGFRALTAAQIAAWNAAVGNYAKTDIFGDSRNPSGLNLYIKLNQNLHTVGTSPISTPALPGSAVGPTTITLTGTAGTPTLSLAWTGGNVPANTKWIIMVTKQLSPGISNLKGKYRVLVIEAAATASPANILSAYTAKFGTLVAGQQIGVRVVAVNTTTGQANSGLNGTCIVGA
jgi:hypothetical protein